MNEFEFETDMKKCLFFIIQNTHGSSSMHVLCVSACIAPDIIKHASDNKENMTLDTNANHAVLQRDIFQQNTTWQIEFILQHSIWHIDILQNNLSDLDFARLLPD